MAILYTRKGEEIIVDEDDYEALRHKTWHVRVDGYVATTIPTDEWRTDSKRRKQKLVNIHRVIMGFPDMHIDHINGNKKDNRRCNLRLATTSQNAANNKRARDNRSGFKGVKRSSGCKNYRATIVVHGKEISLGSFPTPEQAHDAYRSAAIKYFGEFARFE